MERLCDRFLVPFVRFRDIYISFERTSPRNVLASLPFDFIPAKFQRSREETICKEATIPCAINKRYQYRAH